MSNQQEQELRLQQEILSEAQKKAERVIARAEADCKASVKQAEEGNAKSREAALAQARADGERKGRNIIRGTWMERRRLWLEQREKCLEECFGAVLEQAHVLQDGARRAESLAALAKEAILSLEADELIAIVAPQDAAVVTAQWLAALAPDFKDIAFTVREDAKMKGGIRLESADGARSYDNSYTGRLTRLKESFRRELATKGGIFTEDI